MATDHEPRPLRCTQCGEQRFWLLPAPPESHENLGSAALDVMLGGLRAMMAHGWTDTYVCRSCGAVVVRVCDLAHFARLAAIPASSLREVTGPADAAASRSA